MAALQIGLRENKLIEIHEEWLLQRGDGWWLVPSLGQIKIKGVPKMVPLNSLAYEALFGKIPRIGGRFFHHWKDGNSFKHTWRERVSGQGCTICTSTILAIPSRPGSHNVASITQ